jgi:hypothetical protein
MLGRSKEFLLLQWRLVTYLVLAVAIGLATLLTSGPAPALAVALTATGASLLGNAWQAGPKPKLEIVVCDPPELWPSDALAQIFSQASDSETDAPASPELQGVFGVLRPLDKAALLKDAVATARAKAPREGRLNAILGLGMQQFEQPTEADYELFSDQIQRYEKDIQDWLGEVDAFLSTRRSILVAQAQLTNHAKVDAEEAGVVLSLPSAFEMVEEIPHLPEQPESPTFRRRPSALSRTMGMAHAYSGGSAPIVPPVRFAEERSAPKPRRPSYRAEAQGGVEVKYPRALIRHRETTTNERLVVRCREPGEHEVRWVIHARNLPHPASGVGTLDYRPEEMGDPVRALVDLEHFLAELDIQN